MSHSLQRPALLLISLATVVTLSHTRDGYAGEPILTPEIVVTANRVPVEKDKVGSAVTVITREEIEKSGETSAYDILKKTPGITISRNGGAGATSVLRLRGSNPGQVRVLIDGVYVNDPSNIGTEYDFNDLLTHNIERIEVLRGPQSALYGSDAMGGVINITTRKGDGPTRYNGLVEVGSYNTFRQAGGLSGSEGGFDYSLQADHQITEGFSRSSAGTEEDGSNIINITTNLGYQVNDNIEVRVNGGVLDSKTEFDPGSTTDGPAWHDSRKIFGKVATHIDTFDDRWEHKVSIEGSDTNREFDEPQGFNRFSTFDSSTVRGEYQSNLKLRERDVLTAGAMLERQEAKNTNTSTVGVLSTSIDDDVTNNAVYGQYMLGIGNDTTVTGGLRRDDNDIFGAETTYRGTIAHNFPSMGTTVRGSVGTGYKAPTLFQLFSSFGNAALQEETNIGYDAGIDQSLLDERLKLSLTGFYTKYDDLIDYDFGTNRYQNVDKATTKGMEASANLDITDEWSAYSTYTYLLAENETTNRRLGRRPKHNLVVGSQYDVFSGGQVGADVRYVSNQLDSTFTNINTKPYTVVDVHGSVEINPHAELYGRIDNLFNKDYQEVNNFNATEMAVYVGVRGNY